MKKTIILLLTFVFFTFIGFSQNNKDTSNKHVKTVEKTIIISTDDDDSENIEVNCESMNCDKAMFHNECGGKCKKHMKFMNKEKCGKNKFNSSQRFYPMTHTRKLFALMPVILFLFLFIVFLFWLRRENFRLSDALSSRLPEVIKTNNTRQDPTDPSKTITEIKEEIYYHRSTSKLIAFFTAIAGIVVVICGLAFHAYTMLSGIGGGCGKHHCGGVIIIVLVLFVGMLPYIFKTMFKK